MFDLVKKAIPNSLRALARQELLRPRFRKRCAALAGRRKIIYALTPPSGLANIGDHAQVVAISRWFQAHFPDFPVLEVDKNESVQYIDVLAQAVEPGDVIFLHSGGNLGDRGVWSERARRGLITRFAKNAVVSLPQTIYFSDTEKGKAECNRTREIYAAHPNLTIIGRDAVSARLAGELFPNATTFAIPDFVLSLPMRQSTPAHAPARVLLCLRNDDESILNGDRRRQLIAAAGESATVLDTQHHAPIAIGKREAILEALLHRFSQHDIVVTDRYHGAIFSVISGKPTVVLPTVDHKLTSAIDWFSDYQNVRMVENIENIESVIAELLAVTQPAPVDWNRSYFEPLASRLKADVFA